MKYVSIIGIMLVLLGCDLCNHDSEEALINTWVKNEDSFLDPNTFSRAVKLDKNNYGFIFEADGNFIERKNSGWCGTPPISYKNYEGKWKYLSYGFVEIIVDFWGGVDTFQIEILSVDENELTINYIYDYEK